MGTAVILALARNTRVREIIDTLAKLKIHYIIPRPSSNNVAYSTNCLLVYDSEELTSMIDCTQSMYLDPGLDPIIAASAIAARTLRHRSLRIGIDVGKEALTAAVIVNGAPLGIKHFTDISELENYVCMLIAALKPDTIFINVGREGLANSNIVLNSVCGLGVNTVEEKQSNNEITPLHRHVGGGGRRRDRIAAINIALA